MFVEVRCLIEAKLGMNYFLKQVVGHWIVYVEEVLCLGLDIVCSCGEEAVAHIPVSSQTIQRRNCTRA